MKHVLLLEDDRGIADLLSALLEDDGYYVSSTSRVADATQILQKSKIDLLIADIALSDGTAFAPIDEGKKQNIACRLMNGSWPHMAQLEANGELHLTNPFKIKHCTSQVLQRIGPGDGHN